MAASFEMTESAAQRLRDVVRRIPQAIVIDETNKKGVVWCEDYRTANILRDRLSEDDFQVHIRKGLKTNHYYVAAYY